MKCKQNRTKKQRIIIIIGHRKRNIQKHANEIKQKTNLITKRNEIMKQSKTCKRNQHKNQVMLIERNPTNKSIKVMQE